MSNFLVDFGAANVGLATVGYTQLKADGTVAVARTAVGVVAFGHGVYGATVTPGALATAIQWDTGQTVPSYAVEDIAIAANIKQVNDITVTGTGASGNEWGPL